MAVSYNSEQLHTLMENFYVLTGIKTVVYDSEMGTIAAVPYEECAFCAAMSRVPAAMKRCRDCNAEAVMACKKKKGLHIYKCHAGLVEAITPIFIGDVIVGYMMLGQVLAKADSEAKAEDIVAYAASFIGEEARDCFSKLTPKTDEEVKAAAKIMESCVCYLLMNRVITEENGKAAFALVEYIDAHLTEPLLVSDLCRVFQISRNTLYRIADTYLGMPVAKYIKQKRVEKAAELIRDGASVTEVAERLGFCDYSYFGKVFKAVTGKTPTESRKQE